MPGKMKVDSSRMLIRFLQSTSKLMRVEAFFSFGVLNHVFNRMSKSEQREFAGAAERSGRSITLYIAGQIHSALGDEGRCVELTKLASEKGSPSAGMQLGGHYLKYARISRDKKLFKLAMEVLHCVCALGQSSGM